MNRCVSPPHIPPRAVIAPAPLRLAFPAHPKKAFRHPPPRIALPVLAWHQRSEEHTSELQSLMRISYAVFCLKKKKNNKIQQHAQHTYNTQVKEHYKDINRQ